MGGWGSGGVGMRTGNWGMALGIGNGGTGWEWGSVTGGPVGVGERERGDGLEMGKGHGVWGSCIGVWGDGTSCGACVNVSRLA